MFDTYIVFFININQSAATELSTTPYTSHLINLTSYPFTPPQTSPVASAPLALWIPRVAARRILPFLRGQPLKLPKVLSQRYLRPILQQPLLTRLVPPACPRLSPHDPPSPLLCCRSFPRIGLDSGSLVRPDCDEIAPDCAGEPPTPDSPPDHFRARVLIAFLWPPCTPPSDPCPLCPHCCCF